MVLTKMQQLAPRGHAAPGDRVLYRSNAQSRVLESGCSTPACPTACTAACASSSAPRSKHALAYLRLLENPNDDTSFLRVVNFRRAASARVPSSSCRTPPRQRAASGADVSAPVSGRRASTRRLRAQLVDHMRERHPGLTLREIIELDPAAQRAAGALPHREGRGRPHREPGGTGQRRRELRDAGGLRQGRRGAAGGRDQAPAGAGPADRCR